MKEIIYLDTDIINSMLAQLDEGIINTFTLENNTQETLGKETQSTNSTGAKVNGGIKLSTGILPGGSISIGTDANSLGLESEKHNTSILEGQKDILNKAFHDHALEILIDKLNQKQLLKNVGANEGDLLFVTSSFKFYDFDLIQNSLSTDHLTKLLLFNPDRPLPTEEDAKQTVQKLKNKPQHKDYQLAKQTLDILESQKPLLHLFDGLKNFGDYTSQLLPNQAIIKADNYIGIVQNKYLRESPTLLTFRTDTSRKVKILLRVIGVKKDASNTHLLQNFKERDIDKIPSMILDIMLGSLKILLDNDILVTPIAIYFE